jgi:hypothetical protein
MGKSQTETLANTRKSLAESLDKSVERKSQTETLDIWVVKILSRNSGSLFENLLHIFCRLWHNFIELATNILAFQRHNSTQYMQINIHTYPRLTARI